MGRGVRLALWRANDHGGHLNPVGKKGWPRGCGWATFFEFMALFFGTPEGTDCPTNNHLAVANEAQVDGRLERLGTGLGAVEDST